MSWRMRQGTLQQMQQRIKISLAGMDLMIPRTRRTGVWGINGSLREFVSWWLSMCTHPSLPFCDVINDGMVSRTFASSAPSMATQNIIQQFGISREISDLTTTTFLLGYVFGVCTIPLYIIHFNDQPLFLQPATALGTRFWSHRSQTRFRISAHLVHPLPPWPNSSPEHSNPPRDSFLFRFFRSGTIDEQWWCDCGYLVFCW